MYMYLFSFPYFENASVILEMDRFFFAKFFFGLKFLCLSNNNEIRNMNRCYAMRIVRASGLARGFRSVVFEVTSHYSWSD